MTEEKPGVLAVVTDVEPEYEDEYRRWMTEEVLPARVALDGVIGARQWVLKDIGQKVGISMGLLPRHLLMYDFEDVTIPVQPPFRALAGSSEWGRRITPHMHNVYRGNFEEVFRL